MAPVVITTPLIFEDTMSNENALIEWTGLGAKHLATEHGNAFCIPGAITPIPLAIWSTARPWIQDLIVPSINSIDQTAKEQGRFIEHHLKAKTVEIPEKKASGSGKVIEEARTETILEALDLADLEDSEARKIIGKIVDPQILQGYLDNPDLDSKASLKGAIERRLKEVEEKGKQK